MYRYIFNQVVHVSWQELTTAMAGAAGLEDVRQAHRTYAAPGHSWPWVHTTARSTHGIGRAPYLVHSAEPLIPPPLSRFSFLVFM